MRKEKHRVVTLKVPRFRETRDGKFMIDGSPLMCLIGTLSCTKPCRNCGGLPIELELVHQGRRYAFTCYEVVSRTGKVVSETDYDRLAEYLMARKEFLKEKERCEK